MNPIDRLSRIAQALERQVQQHEEAVARSQAYRDQNLEMRERDIHAQLSLREADTAAILHVNADLMQRLDVLLANQQHIQSALAAFNERITALERKS